ncbi:MAG: endonuclease/exonuclease/phosphatase family protein [Verrucomicrobiales bacterium]|nr:endonuclease/exonuclease/phosphatase family protein [Verrucomicrobiales bacterium]
MADIMHFKSFRMMPASSQKTSRKIFSLLRWMWRVLPEALLILTMASLMVRLTVRDAFVWSAALFYIAPWPVMLLAWPVLGWWRRGKRGALPLAAAGLAVTVAGWMLGPGPPPVRMEGTPGMPVKVMFWNIGHRSSLPAELHELADRFQPDILAVAEAENIRAEERASFVQRHPGYRIESFRDSLQVALRGQATVRPPFRVMAGTRAHLLEIRLAGREEPWTLLLADLPPMPLTPRTDRTDQLRKLAGNGPRTLILGDFNTPYDSCAFDSWRRDFHHGLSQASVTPGPAMWPIGLPLLAIDHVWMSKDLIPLQAWKGTPLGHDHAWQIISIAPVGRP